MTEQEKHDDLSAWIADVETKKSNDMDVENLSDFVAVAELFPEFSKNMTLANILSVFNEHGF